ncbi:MAG: hypothetical protein DHS20C13_28020 [Thermodesulfobacteriota bacterium]|nr:MAG: hypothetical protein DHS20C13_28020 [Thermodesulfobacteriota bacterium]
MKKYYTLVSFLAIILSSTACTSTSMTRNVVEPSKPDNTLLVYEDGRMEFNSRFVNDDEVVIYNDGRGGERAAIKVRVPIHSDFYRDSIIVVRVADQFDESVADGKDDIVNTDIIN